MKEKIKKFLKKWIKKAKKSKILKVVGIHAATIIAMILGLYLAAQFLAPLGWFFMKLVAAMIIGAYALKPAADWICKKVL